jgi:hypothetical protein
MEIQSNEIWQRHIFQKLNEDYGKPKIWIILLIYRKITTTLIIIYASQPEGEHKRIKK